MMTEVLAHALDKAPKVAEATGSAVSQLAAGQLTDVQRKVLQLVAWKKVILWDTLDIIYLGAACAK